MLAVRLAGPCLFPPQRQRISRRGRGQGCGPPHRYIRLVPAPRTVLITGSTDGLGLALARRLAGDGDSVLVHGRDPQKVDRVVDELGDGARGYVADLSSLEQARRLAAEVPAQHETLDVLVNNAGIITATGRETSADGHEAAFAVNYVAHFLLTIELLEALRATDGSRIVNVASLGQ